MKKITSTIITLSFLFSFVIPLGVTIVTLHPAKADTEVPNSYTLLEPLPCIPSTETPCDAPLKKEVDLKTYVGYIFRLAIAIAAFAAVFMITLGGFQYMISEGWGGKDNAKKRIKNAILGLLAALVSYLFLYTIDPRLVQIRTEIPPIVVPRTQLQFNGLEDALTQGFATEVEVKKLQQQAGEYTSEAERLEEVVASDNSIDVVQAEVLLEKAAALRQEAKQVRGQITIKRAESQADIQIQEIEKQIDTTKLSFTDYAVGVGFFLNPIAAIVTAKADSYLKGTKLSNEDEIIAAQKTLEEVFDKKIAEVGQQDPETVQKLKDEKEVYISDVKYKVYDKKAEIAANKFSTQKSNEYIDKLISDISTESNKKVVTIKDPELKQRYQNQADLAITLLKGYKK